MGDPVLRGVRNRPAVSRLLGLLVLLSPAVTFGVTGPAAAATAPTGPGAISWGDNQAGQLGDETLTAPNRPTPGAVVGLPVGVTQLAAGERHVLTLSSDHRVFAWGANEVGQLGDGTDSPPSSPRVRPQPVPST